MQPIATNRLQLVADAEDISAFSVINVETGEQLCQNGVQCLLVRAPLKPSVPDRLSVVSREPGEGGSMGFELADEDKKNNARLIITPHNEGLHFTLFVNSAEPIWLVEWSLTGLHFGQVIVPALGGQVIDKSMPRDHVLSYKYPFWWNAQMVIGTSAKGGLCFRSCDPDPHLKLLRVRKQSDGFQLSYGFEAPGPINANTMQAEWYVEGFKGTWHKAADRHRQWLEDAFELKPVLEHPHAPSWIDDINFVLELWGDRKGQPQPGHTFDQMVDRIREWRKFHPPEKTLLYLAGFAEHGIDSNAPDYNPGPRLGGRERFKVLVEAAHELGYPVMIHTNVLAMTYHHPLFQKFKQHQVVDVFGRPQGWGLDMDGDWLPEPYFAYMNPGASEWSELMQQVLGELIETYDLDAVFLDQTLLAFNVSQGPNFVTGMRQHIERLQKAFPRVLFAGEGLHEQVLPALPLAQIHGIDSIADVHGMEGQTPWRRPHPVSTYLFGKYTRFVAHLLTKHPSHPMFAFQEAAYKDLGVIPALVLYDASQAIDTPETRAMLERARNLRGNSREY